MQIRCYACHKPYALGREAIRQALEIIRENNLSHYDAPCPHCRRVNRISPDELKRHAPPAVEAPAEESVSS